MAHIKSISSKRKQFPPALPAEAMSLLEKQAMTEMIEENLSQVAVFINLIAGLKSQDA